jgi:hypothetical protein
MPCVHSSFYVVQAEVTQRLSIAKEAANRSATVQSHEDLARKLKVIYCFFLSYIHLSGCALELVVHAWFEAKSCESTPFQKI